jgi:UDP-N-acetylmuramoyl-tripeptide--D-alanyl-D-alanine ligase
MISTACQTTEAIEMVSVEDILQATQGKILCHAADSFSGVSIDSRKVQEGELFVALRGDRFDGHDFLPGALKKGSGALVHMRMQEPPPDKTLIFVENTLKALQDIARYMRLKKEIPVVAITGSNGKTTTKELIAEILGTQYRVIKNTGNLNNHIGLPLSLTALSEEDEIAVLEMGASASGEIRALCAIALPTHGVLTNISHAHIQGFKDIETIRRTKLELLETAGVAVVNADDHFMMEGLGMLDYKGRIMRYGVHNTADISATGISLHETGSSFMLHIGENLSLMVNPKISGMFNIYNLLAAAAVGSLFHIDPVNIQKAIDSFRGVPMRLELREIDGVKVISDMYNANPASVEGALRELARIKKGRLIAVLGDMLELGSYEEEAHRNVGRLMSELTVDIFIAVGHGMAMAASEFRGCMYAAQSAEEAGEILRNTWKDGDTVLIKGSRGMHMEKVLAGGS